MFSLIQYRWQSCTGVARKVNQFYENYVKADNIKTVFNLPAGHTFVSFPCWFTQYLQVVSKLVSPEIFCSFLRNRLEAGSAPLPFGRRTDAHGTPDMWQRYCIMATPSPFLSLQARKTVLGIFKMIATSGFLTALERTKFVFGRSPPRTPLGELTALPRPPN